MPKVIVLDTGYESYEYEEKLLTRAGYKFEIFRGANDDREAKIKAAQDAIALFIRWTKIDDAFLDATPALQAIVRYGVGYDNVDLDAANRHHVKVANVQGYANHSVSDHALALMYACARALPQGEQSLISNFSKPPIRNIFEFHEMTLGIIGLGRIGGTLCQKARHLFKNVLAADPYIAEQRFAELGAQKTDLNTLLRESNVISIHCNLTDETKGLINARRFKLMQKRPILINTARGPIVDESDFIAALKDGLVHSAGVDVFQDEPPKTGNELLSLPNVITTGHYAWYSISAAKELQKRAADNLLMLLQGKCPEDCLT